MLISVTFTGLTTRPERRRLASGVALIKSARAGSTGHSYDCPTKTRPTSLPVLKPLLVDDHAEDLTIILSQIDFEKLTKEFVKIPRKNAVVQDIREIVEMKLNS